MQTIYTLDLFNVVKNAGLKQGFIFYSLGFFGTLLMTISFLFIIIQSLNTENSIDIQYLVKLMKSIANKQELTQLSNIELITTNEQINNYVYKGNYYQKELTLEKDKIYHHKNLKLQLHDFINQYDDCGKHCINVQYKQQINTQILYLQSICLTFNENNIIGGCYENNQIAQYSQTLIDKIIVQMRHSTDPLVQFNKKEITLQQGYDPKFLIIIGGMCLFGCVMILVQIQLNNKKQETIEIEMQNIVPQRVIPLNY